jgi:hypothetical protein
MYRHTHNKSGRTEWPDSGGYLQQLHIVIEMWEMIGVVVKEYADERKATK